MTCIAGLVHKGNVYIGGDSAGVAGQQIIARKDEKVFKNGEFIIGFTSSFRMGQLLRYKFTPPEIKEGQDLFEYMVKDFVEEVRICFKTGGYTSMINTNNERGGTFLIGVRGRLFEIDCDFQVGENLCGFASVGCGESYALGALDVNTKLKPKDRIIQALETASKFSTGVCAPFMVLSNE